MSKRSAKALQPPPTPPAGNRKTPLIIGTVAILLLAIAVFALVQSDRGQSSVPAEATATVVSTPAPAADAPAPAPPSVDPPSVVLKPHPQKNFPPLQLPGYPLGRSPEVITAAYRFAAEHPEVLTYVPCFCGCERSGHRGNEDCFVRSRAANGDVQEWEPHGMECNVCLDVAQQAMQMYTSGASVRDIRAAVEGKWASQAQSHTHTPAPPK